MNLSVIIAFLLLLIAYLLGSFPTGFLIAKFLMGIDIREQGSGSTGATNILRTVGKIPAIFVLLIDALKGVAAISLIYSIYTFWNQDNLLPENWQSWLVAGAGLAAIIGHSKSIWLNFSGGKSVATSLGILLAMSWQIGLGTAAVFAVFIAISRIVSLSSIAAAIAVSLLMIIFHQPLAYQLFAALAGLYVIWRHQANIQRLIAGTEPQLGQKLATSENPEITLNQ